MDYPLQYTDSPHHSRQQDSATTDYRTYPMLSERSDISSIMFDGSSSAAAEEEDSHSSIMVLSTRPPHSIHDPWNQPQLHHHQQLHHSPLLNSDYRQQQPIQHQHMQQQEAHSERGIAGFVSKLYQCLQSAESSQKYARWCQHEGKDMFIIDCIPEFTKFVLPRLFKHCKFPSFVRQLNIYGFQRDTDARKSKDTKDKESCRWYHPCFRPGQRDLFHLIRRKAIRYSRKRKDKTSNDEDPETILNLGSADESDMDEESLVLLVNNDPDEGRRSSSASSAAQSMQPIDYNSKSSQLQVCFSEPVAVTTTTTTTASTNSPRTTIPLAVNTNMTDEYRAMTTPTLANNLLQQDDLPASEHADANGLVLDMQHRHHFEQKQLYRPLMRGQELGLQLYHMKQHYEKMHAYFKEQLNTAQIQIDEQQIRIQQLEGALGITKHSVKQQPATGGFHMPNYGVQQNSVVIPTHHGSMYQMQSNITTTPRPNQFYFHENASLTCPTMASGSTNSNNTNNIDPANDPKMMVQIKNEIISSPSTPSTSSNNWLPYHRDSLSSVAIDSPNSNSNGIIVTAGSDTHQSPHTGRDNNSSTTSKPSSTPSNVHNNVNSSNNNNHHDTSKIDLMGHMNFNTFL